MRLLIIIRSDHGVPYWARPSVQPAGPVRCPLRARTNYEGLEIGHGTGGRGHAPAGGDLTRGTNGGRHTCPAATGPRLRVRYNGAVFLGPMPSAPPTLPPCPWPAPPLLSSPRFHAPNHQNFHRRSLARLPPLLFDLPLTVAVTNSQSVLSH